MKIAVIGGGIVGSTASFYLSKNNHHVTLFDEGTGQASKAAAGIISPWLSQRRNKNWYHLARLGAQFYPQLMADLGLTADSDIYRQVGTILFKKNSELLKKLVVLAETRKVEAPEIGEIKLLNPAEIANYFPLLKQNQQALYVSGGAKVDGKALVETLINTFINGGGRFKTDKVMQIKPVETHWEVTTASKTEKFDRVFLATGAWLPDLIEPLGFQVDIRAQKGQLAEIRVPYETTTWPVVMPQGESDIIPFNNGRILIGASHENDQLYNLSPNKTVLQNLLDSIQPLSDELSDVEIEDFRVGTRAYTSDFLPFFGEVTELPGLFVASGLGSSGLTTGPIIAYTISAWLTGQETSLDPADYQADPYIQKKTHHDI